MEDISAQGPNLSTKTASQAHVPVNPLLIIFIIMFRDPVDAVEVKLSVNCLRSVQFWL